jgi:hypothetical protein
MGIDGVRRVDSHRLAPPTDLRGEGSSAAAIQQLEFPPPVRASLCVSCRSVSSEVFGSWPKWIWHASRWHAQVANHFSYL